MHEASFRRLLGGRRVALRMTISVAGIRLWGTRAEQHAAPNAATIAPQTGEGHVPCVRRGGAGRGVVEGYGRGKGFLQSRNTLSGPSSDLRQVW